MGTPLKLRMSPSRFIGGCLEFKVRVRPVKLVLGGPIRDKIY